MSYKPAPYSGQLADLGGYVERELARISQAMQRAQGGGALELSIAGVPQAPHAVTTTPSLFADYDKVTPERALAGVQPELSGQLWIREPGLWAFGFEIAALIPSGEEMAMSVYLDGVAMSVYGSQTAQNTASILSFSGVGLNRIDLEHQAGKVELYHVSRGSASVQWTSYGASFCAWRVGD